MFGRAVGSRDVYPEPRRGKVPAVTVVPTEGGAMTGMTWTF